MLVERLEQERKELPVKVGQLEISSVNPFVVGVLRADTPPADGRGTSWRIQTHVLFTIQPRQSKIRESSLILWNARVVRQIVSISF